GLARSLLFGRRAAGAPDVRVRAGDRRPRGRHRPRGAEDGLVGPVGSDLEAPLTEAAAAFLRSYLTRLPADHPHHRARVTAFAFAAAEGEGDRSLVWWRAAHTAFFGRVLARLGGRLDATSIVVCERFRLL